jgi:ribosomal protein S18 acetylase RimI-like enzyme
MEVELVPMDKKQFARFYERSVQRYAQENIKAGYRTETEAESRSKEDHKKLLPKGLRTPDHILMVVRSRSTGEEVGTIWMKVERGDRPSGFIYDIFLEERFRGMGYGKATLRALESLAREKGLGSLFLHVFAHNPVAIRLYQGTGFKVKSMNMEKVLD